MGYGNGPRERGKSNGEIVNGVLCAKTRKAEGPTVKLIQFNHYNTFLPNIVLTDYLLIDRLENKEIIIIKM